MDATTLLKLFNFMKDHPEGSQADFIENFVNEGSHNESGHEQESRVESVGEQDQGSPDELPSERESFEELPGEKDGLNELMSEQDSRDELPGERESVEDLPGQRESVEDSPGQRESVEDSPGQRESVEDLPDERATHGKSAGQDSRDESGSEQDSDKVALYFSKTQNPHKAKLHYLIRKACKEVSAYGEKRFSQVSPAAKKYIHDRVVVSFPDLVGHEMELDKVVSRVLTQAKYYCKRMRNKSVKEGSGMARSPAKARSPGKARSPRKARSPGKARSPDQVNSKITKTKPKSTVSTARSSTTGAKGVKRSTEKSVDKSSGKARSPDQVKIKKTKQKSTVSTSAGAKGVKRSTEKNQYELKCLAKRKTAERVKKAMFDKKFTSDGFTPGDTVLITHNGKDIGKAIYVQKRNELFAEVIFSEQLTSGSEVDLYEVVPENDELQRVRKVSFGQLEPNDVFIWKVDKIKVSKSRLRSTPKAVERYDPVM